jgi:hypothetical protein
MRRSLVIALTVVVLGGCTPAAIQPTLADVRSLGFACGDGARDNVPSGLYQWHCSGTVAAKDGTILVNGNDGGVAEIDLAINSADPAVMRSEFRRVAIEVMPLRLAPALADALVVWSGPLRATVIRSARIASECDATQCIVEVTSIDGPLRPLRLP